MSKMGYVYVMTNKNKTTLYIGVTNDLCRRIYEHKNHLMKNSFTDRYNLEYCIYFEEFVYFDLAIHREKELKKWNRQKKEDLINKKNPKWNVLVTENGFVRDTTPFSQQVTAIIKELQQNSEIPPYGRNDEAGNEQIPPSGRNDNNQEGVKSVEIPLYSRNDGLSDGGKGRELGGSAAQFSPPSPKTEDVIPNATQWSEETQQIPPYGRNDNTPADVCGKAGGFAARFSSPSLFIEARYSERSEESANVFVETIRHSEQSEETQPKKGNNL